MLHEESWGELNYFAKSKSFKIAWKKKWLYNIRRFFFIAYFLEQNVFFFKTVRNISKKITELFTFNYKYRKHQGFFLIPNGFQITFYMTEACCVRIVRCMFSDVNRHYIWSNLIKFVKFKIKIDSSPFILPFLL